MLRFANSLPLKSEKFLINSTIQKTTKELAEKALIIKAKLKRKVRAAYSSPIPPGMPPGPPGPPLGALAVMTSSMRKMSAADSAADLIACSLTMIGSMTPFAMLS
jgi:hypothetical protein